MIFSPQRQELTDSLNVARFLDGDVKSDLASYIENAVVSFQQSGFPDNLVNILMKSRISGWSDPILQCESKSCVLLIFGVGELFNSHPVDDSLSNIPVTDSLFVNIPVADSFDNIRMALAIHPLL